MHNLNPYQTWHQLAVEMQVQNKAGNKHSQIVVYERRESDIENSTWRIAHLS